MRAVRKYKVRRHYLSGLSYVEVLVAVFLLMLALVPAMEAIQTGVSNNRAYENLSDQDNAITSKLEQVLVQPFHKLDAAALAAADFNTPSSYSDPPGSSNRCLVYLSHYDGDNADGDNNPLTGTDPELLIVKVTSESTGSFLETLVSR